MNKVKIAMCDLTHVGQTIASNAMPYGVALIAAYALQQLGDAIDVQIYKYPDDFATALDQGIPDIVCFSNYLWNIHLSYAYASRIKAARPETIIVFGGPNFANEDTERKDFLQTHPAIDFHIYKEGERAFLELLQQLMELNLDLQAFRTQRRQTPACHYLAGDDLISGPLPPRIRDLDEIPSPYAMGLLDKFFEARLLPMLQTNRGCPFSCTFCTEGQTYFQKVYRYSQQRIRADLNYMAARVQGLRDILIADSNFAMFREDLDTCRELARLREEVGWPQYLMVSTGKNQKERVLEAAGILKGALHLSASLQSTDPEVLKAIRRSNIDTSQLMDVGKKAASIDSNSVSELILGLPNDSLAAHKRSIKAGIDADINTIRMFQFILLPGTEGASPASREKYQMLTKWRVLSGCFGNYRFGSETFPSVEIEEMCVSNATLPYEDYLEGRSFNLTIELMYNYGYFRELHRLLRYLDVSVFDSLDFIHQQQEQFPAKLKQLYAQFREHTHNQLWDNAAELETHLMQPENLARHLSGELGGRVLFDHKAIAYFDATISEQLHDTVFALTSEFLATQGVLNKDLANYLAELKLYSKHRKIHLLDVEVSPSEHFHYDFEALHAQDFFADPLAYSLPQGLQIDFVHAPDWKQNIQDYVQRYGLSTQGLGQILLRAPIDRFYRIAQPAQTTSVALK